MRRREEQSRKKIADQLIVSRRAEQTNIISKTESDRRPEYR